MGRPMTQPEMRRAAILDLVRRDGRVSVNALAEALGASRETIRRDLSELEAAGGLRKVHGGAIAPEPPVYQFGSEGPFQARMQDCADAKRAIARAAAPLFQTGDTLFIDTGSTTLFFAEELAGKSGLTVITNSGLIAAHAARGAEQRVIQLGGDFRGDGAETVGAVTIEQIGLYQVTHAVLTIGGLTEKGAHDYDAAEAEVARAMARQAHWVVLLAHQEKFYRSAPYLAVDLARIDVLVTDAAPEGPLADALDAARVEVVLALP